MRNGAPFYSRRFAPKCSIEGTMIAFRLLLREGAFSALAVVMKAIPALAAPGPVDPNSRYQSCLSLANLNPTAALGVAADWSKAKGGAPAEHCTAMALIELRRYPEAAARLDALGRAPDMGNLRSSVFDQAGNAWMLAGDAAKAAASF